MATVQATAIAPCLCRSVFLHAGHCCQEVGLAGAIPKPFCICGVWWSGICSSNGASQEIVEASNSDIDAPVLGLSAALQGETKASAGKRCGSISPRISMTDVLLRTQSTSYFNSMTVGLGCLQRRVAALSLERLVCTGPSVHGWIRVLGACSASTAGFFVLWRADISSALRSVDLLSALGVGFSKAFNFLRAFAP